MGVTLLVLSFAMVSVLLALLIVYVSSSLRGLPSYAYSYADRQDRIDQQNAADPMFEQTVFKTHSEFLTRKVDIERFTRDDRMAAQGIRKAGVKRASKRFIDLVLAFSLLIFLAPLLALTSIAIVLESRGPIFDRQTRVGLDGRPFRIFKFRSMRTDAERNGPQWASSNDARVTRVGKIIRKLRIDEIPQAINIIANEMSFVGPRPERPEFVEILEKEIPNYQERHYVKPGLTGWAQVNFEYGDSIEDAWEKLEYDLYYVKHYSNFLDIRIVLMTFRVAFFGIGSR